MRGSGCRLDRIAIVERWQEGESRGKRAPRRQTPGADYPRLGTTTVMFIGRNGGKRESSQKVKKQRKRSIVSKYLEQVHLVAEKKKWTTKTEEEHSHCHMLAR